MISVQIYADEVVLNLQQLPRRIRAALRAKFEQIFTEFRTEVFSKVPGKFLDQSYIKTGVTDIGSTVVGFIEGEDKPGTYIITPKTKAFLQFTTKDYGFVKTKLVNHPYLKSAPMVERAILESKPWILDQLENAVIEAL